MAALAAAALVARHAGEPTLAARLGLAAGVGAVMWAAWRVDNHTGSCLMATVLVLIVLAVLALLVVGVALPAFLR